MLEMFKIEENTGAMVLASETMLIADLDVEHPTHLVDCATFASKAAAFMHVFDWHKYNPQYGLAIYETMGGLRIFITNYQFFTDSFLAKHILEGLRSDPVYNVLCYEKSRFHARVSVKPHREEKIAAERRYILPPSGGEVFDPELAMQLSVHDHLLEYYKVETPDPYDPLYYTKKVSERYK